MRSLTPTAVAALALAAVLATGSALAQQTAPKTPERPGMGHGAMMKNGEMGARHEKMMAKHAQMKADMQAMTVSLDQKLAAMNAAKGNSRVDAMAAVINEMATQRKHMVAHMSTMHEQMMGQMGEPMGQSADKTGPADAHSEHHEKKK